MRVLVLLTLGLSFGTSVRAQLPGQAEFDVVADDMTVEVGEAFTLPIHVVTDTPTGWLALYITNDAGVCQPIAFEPGAGPIQYEATHGAFPCDVGILPDHVFVSMQFLPIPYDSQVYGTEFVRLDYQGTATQPGTTTIEILDAYTFAPKATVAVTVVPEPVEFVRGDVDGDGLCTIGDAIGVLELVFLPGGGTDCWDAADVEDDGALNIADAIRLLQTLFVEPGGAPETCAIDETSDALPACERDTCTSP